MVRNKLCLLVIGLFPLLMTGCDVKLENADEILKAAESVGIKLDESTKRLLVAVDKAAGESDEWRQLVDKMRRDVRDLPAEGSVEAKAFIDFALARAKENVEEINKITKLIDGKNYAEALKSFMALQKVLSKSPPVIASVSPKVIEYSSSEFGPEKKDCNLATVALYGWNFDVGKKNFVLCIQNDDKKTTRIVSKSLVITSPYVAQVDVSTGSGITFAPGETRLVLLHDDKVISTVPITWSAKESLLSGSYKRTARPEESQIVPEETPNRFKNS